MILALLLLVVSAVVIYFSCEFFVSGIEWVGQRFGIARSAVGTVLAAFGTALPETVVTFVAVVFGSSDSQRQIGVGAALGGPLVLGTVTYAVVGIAFLFGAEKRGVDFLANVDTRKLSRDQTLFIGIFLCKVLLGVVAFDGKPWLGTLFLAAYGVYALTEMRLEVVGDSLELEPLKLQPRSSNPSTVLVVMQTAGSLLVIFVSSRVFVEQLETIGPWLGMSPQMVALVLSPVATELPETMNALIWVRQGKAALAFGNISGAMMIQATIPTALGLFFTPWLLERPLLWAAVVTLIAIIGLDLLLHRHALTARRLALFLSLYAIFALGVVLFQF